MTTTPHFDAAVGFVLRHEGGYVDDPQDPGGETNMGISRRSYPDLSIALLSRDDVIQIYHRDYWQAARCDELPGPVALLVFDGAVNQGLGAAVRMLQEELGVPVDGMMGPVTVGAACAARPDDLALRYAARRAWRYEINRQEERYGLGWFRRLLDCYRLSMVLG